MIQGVVGSNPAGRANKIKAYRNVSPFSFRTCCQLAIIERMSGARFLCANTYLLVTALQAGHAIFLRNAASAPVSSWLPA